MIILDSKCSSLFRLDILTLAVRSSLGVGSDLGLSVFSRFSFQSRARNKTLGIKTLGIKWRPQKTRACSEHVILQIVCGARA